MTPKKKTRAELIAEVERLRRGVADLRQAQAKIEQEKQLLGQRLASLRALADSTNDVLYSVDIAGVLTYVGPQVERYGLCPADMVGKAFLDFILHEDRDAVLLDFRRSVSTGEEFPTAFRVRDKEGKIRWVEDCGRVQRDKSGRITGISGALRDITARKRLEEQLRKDQRLFMDSQRIAQLGSWEWDIVANVLRWSDETYRIFGVSPETFTPTSDGFLGMVHPHDLKAVTEAIDKAVCEGAPYSIEHRIIRPDGEERIIHEQGEFFCDDEGRPVRTVGTAWDVTERRRAEQVLRENGEKYHKLFDTTSDAVMLIDAETRRFVDVNETAVRLYGYSREEFLRLHHWDITAQSEESDTSIRQTLAGTRSHVPLRYHRKHDGTVFPVEISASRFTLHGRTVLCGVVLDISDRVRMEEVLRHSEEQYRTLVESANSIILRRKVDGTIIFLNSFGQEFFGYNANEIVGRNVVGTIVPGTDRNGRDLATILRDIGERPDRYAVNESEGVCKNGERVWVSWMNHPIRDEQGCVVEILAIGNDLTEQRRMKVALKESEARYRALIEGMPAVLYTARINEVSTATYVSPQVRDLLGFTPEEPPADPDIWHRRLHPDDRDRVMNEVARCHATNRPFVSEYRMIRKDGTVAWFRDSAVICQDPTTQAQVLQGVMMDITERKQAEQELQKRGKFMRRIVDSSLNGIYVYDIRHGVNEFVNPRYTQLTGYTLEELNQMSKNQFFDLFHPEDQAPVAEHMREVTAADDGEILEIEYRFKAKDGHWIWCLSWDAVFEREEDGRARQFIGTFLDITERKDAEDALRESEQKFRTLADESPNMIFITQKGSVVYSNPRCEETTGYSREEFYSRDLSALLSWLPPDSVELAKSKIQRHMKGEDFEPYELTLLTKAGRQVDVLVSPKLIRYEGAPAILGIVTDITDLKRIQATLEKRERQLRQLNMKLTETRDRERREIASWLHDNLGQMLTALGLKLDEIARSGRLPAAAFPSLQEVEETLSQTTDQVRNMTYELDSPVLRRLGLDEALDDLCGHMASQFGIRLLYESEGNISTSAKGMEVVLYDGVRELLHNVVKHARAQGTVVRASRLDDHIRIIVEDDGVGFDPSCIESSFTRNGGFGLYRLQERIERLGGTFQLVTRKSGGTRAIIEVPIAQPSSSEGS